MSINTICVCGAGTMGSDIAQVSAVAGFDTILYEVDLAILEKAKSSIEKNLQTLVEKQKLGTEEKEKIFRLIRFTDDYHQCRAQVIIEAIVENYDAKIALFNQLATINDDKTIFATNTSSLSISKIGNKVTHAQRALGMHFFNPASRMKLVEIVKGEKTSDDVVHDLVDLAGGLRKISVICNDTLALVRNRVARPEVIDALRVYEARKLELDS